MWGKTKCKTRILSGTISIGLVGTVKTYSKTKKCMYVMYVSKCDEPITHGTKKVNVSC